jgi:hypothetical protein
MAEEISLGDRSMVYLVNIFRKRPKFAGAKKRGIRLDGHRGEKRR